MEARFIVVHETHDAIAAWIPRSSTRMVEAEPRNSGGSTEDMTISKHSFIVLAGVLTAALALSGRQTASPLGSLVLPSGFQADVFADKVENARSMALGPQGTVFVGSQYVGKVHAVVDADKDNKADRVVVIASGLDQPNGVAMRNGALYVATASRLLRFDDIEKHLDAPPAPVVVRADLPNPKAGHTWKFIGFGPDDMLYMTVGAPCNVCLSPPMVSAIVRMKPDGSGMEVLRRGRAQQRRVRLAPGHARAVVHRQRPRHARRRRAE